MKKENAYIKTAIEKLPSLNVIYKDIQSDLNKVEKSLDVFAGSANELISEVNSYIFEKKGKRIRPALLLLCTKLFDYSGDEHIMMCTLVEALHTASLIHDDIIDNSDLRRGKKTAHTKWGPNITVLLGDYLYIKTMGYSLQSSHPEIIQIITDTSTQMIDGELFEYYMAGNLEIDEGHYFKIIQQKTAALFAASCQIGGILGQADREEEKSLAEYGEKIGISFQIIDDLLDYLGDEEKLGKPVLSDLGEGRITLPLIYTLNNESPSRRREIIDLINNKDTVTDYKQQILSIIKSNGALDYAYGKAEEYVSKSKESLDDFKESDHLKALRLIADYILVRNN